MFFFFDEKAGSLLFIALRRNKGLQIKREVQGMGWFRSYNYINLVLRIALQCAQAVYDQLQSNPWPPPEFSEIMVLAAGRISENSGIPFFPYVPPLQRDNGFPRFSLFLGHCRPGIHHRWQSNSYACPALVM